MCADEYYVDGILVPDVHYMRYLPPGVEPGDSAYPPCPSNLTCHTIAPSRAARAAPPSPASNPLSTPTWTVGIPDTGTGPCWLVLLS
jgi:hypothetical protein